jgi:hypothetical protein
MSKDISYCGAGVLPFCYDEKHGKLFLLCRETRIDNLTNEIQRDALNDLGGKREEYDTSAVYTAVREMMEESSNLYQDRVPFILKQLHEGTYPKFSLKGNTYVLYMARVEYREPPPNSKLLWVTQADLLGITTDWFDKLKLPIASRLIEVLVSPVNKQRIFTA